MRRALVLTTLACAFLIAACRHIPEAGCRKDCTEEQQLCRNRGGNWWDCSTVFDLCIAACPSAK
jgi:hypothetical protein